MEPQMQIDRKHVGSLCLAEPLSILGGRLVRVLFFIVCCWLCVTVDGQGGGGAVELQCTDYNVTTSADNPPRPKLGQAAAWWSSNDGVEFEFNSGCGIKFKDDKNSGDSNVMWNATVPTGKGYNVTLTFDDKSLQKAVDTGLNQAGIRWWEVGDPCNFTYISFVFHPDPPVYTTYKYSQNCTAGGKTIHQSPVNGAWMDPSQYCARLFTQRRSLPKEMTVYVTPEGNVTLSVKLQGGRELVQTYDYRSVIKGMPPARVGIEIKQAVELDFTNFSASLWEPKAMDITPKPLKDCIDPNAEGLLMNYFIGLAAVTAIVAVHIVLAYRLVRRNYWHDNKPHILTLVCTGIAGLDSFGDIAQVCFFLLAYNAVKDDPTSHETHTLRTYLLVSLILVVVSILYNAVILLYVIGTSGDRMNQKLLMQHRTFFALQAALTVTNLELLPLFPWKYEAFQVTDSEDIKDLEGFPSTRLMVLSVLPVVFVDLPMIVLQALTQQLNNDTFGTKLLVCILALGSLDVICRFFTRAFITASEVESRRRSRNKMFISPATIGHMTVSTDTSVGGPGSVLSGRESISPMTTVGGRDMEHLELGQRPDSAPTTFDPNDVGFFARGRHPHALRKASSCRM